MEASSTRESSFQPFSLTISGKCCSFSSMEEVCAKVQKLSRRIVKKHIQIMIHFADNWKDLSGHTPEREQFITELRKVTDIHIDARCPYFYVIPKIVKEELCSGRQKLVRHYVNHVTEEIECSSINHSWKLSDWNGQRTYPNGRVCRGSFFQFELFQGTSRDSNGVVTHIDIPAMNIRTGETRRPNADIDSDSTQSEGEESSVSANANIDIDSTPLTTWETNKKRFYVFNGCEGGWVLVKIAIWALTFITCGLLFLLIWGGSHAWDYCSDRDL